MRSLIPTAKQAVLQEVQVVNAWKGQFGRTIARPSIEGRSELRPTATETVWLHVTRGDTVTRDAPITAAAYNPLMYIVPFQSICFSGRAI